MLGNKWLKTSAAVTVSDMGDTKESVVFRMDL